MKTTGNLGLKQNLLLLMMVILVLPCALKKEIKDSVFISSHSSEQIEKPNKTANCLSFEKEEIAQAIPVHLVKKIDFNDPEVFIPFVEFHQINPSENRITQSLKSEFTPLFILHEQYLI